jgi:hypothetical protein
MSTPNEPNESHTHLPSGHEATPAAAPESMLETAPEATSTEALSTQAPPEVTAEAVAGFSPQAAAEAAAPQHPSAPPVEQFSWQTQAATEQPQHPAPAATDGQVHGLAQGQGYEQGHAQPAAQGHGAVHPQAPAQSPRKLSTFLKVSIILLAALSIASISLLFIGDFEGKFERVFSTFFAFAVFVGLTAFDTRRGQRNEWYAPVALIANSYILALLLIVIWMTPYSWSLGWEIFWKGLLVIVVTRAVVGCAQLLLGMSEGKPKALSVFAMITSLLATVSGIFFTAPVAIEVFNVEVTDLYWKFAVATLLLTALGLSITLLLRWSYGAEDREATRREREAARAMYAQPYQAQGFPIAPYGVAEPVAPVSPTVVVAEAPAAAPAMQHLPEAAQAQPVYDPAPQQPLLPWPTFADGSPLPVGPDGQPDFSALGR